MQRGIIVLNKMEAQLAQMLAELSAVDLTSLRAKLELVFSTPQEQVRLEVNRDEVEAILDAFPAPSPDQNPIYSELRQKLLGFLNSKEVKQ